MSHHVIGNRDLLVHTRDINHFPIGLPDGKIIISTIQDEVQLFTNIVLHNVYYVPSSNCNLISISQLNLVFVIQSLH